MSEGAYDAYIDGVNLAMKEQLTRYLSAPITLYLYIFYVLCSIFFCLSFDLGSIYAGLTLLTLSAVTMLLLALGGPHVSLRVRPISVFVFFFLSAVCECMCLCECVCVSVLVWPKQLSQGNDYFTAMWACVIMYLYVHFSYPRLDPFALVRLTKS